MNTKTIIIILTILIIISGGYYIYTINQKIAPEIITERPPEDNSFSPVEDNRIIFDTNTATTSSDNENIVNESVSTSTATTSNTTILEVSVGEEDLINKKINRLLFDWETVKDKELLKEALNLSKDTNNESVLSNWSNFMSKYSSELIKITNTDLNIKENIRSLFEWYMEMSGEYEKLSQTKKQEILKQYQQLK